MIFFVYGFIGLLVDVRENSTYKDQKRLLEVASPYWRLLPGGEPFIST